MTTPTSTDIPATFLLALQDGTQVPALAGDAPSAAEAVAQDGSGAPAAAPPQPPSLMFMLVPILFFILVRAISASAVAPRPAAHSLRVRCRSGRGSPSSLGRRQ